MPIYPVWDLKRKTKVENKKDDFSIARRESNADEIKKSNDCGIIDHTRNTQQPSVGLLLLLLGQDTVSEAKRRHGAQQR